MEINFNSDKKKNTKRETELNTGNFESMMKMRKKSMAKFQKEIQAVLEDYQGESICIVIQKEDENGMPDHARIFMAGVSRIESQVAIGKALNDASNQAIEIVVMDSAKGDVKAMLSVAQAIMSIKEDKN